MPEVRRFPRQAVAIGLVLALLALGGLVGWRLHDHRASGATEGAALVLAGIGT